MERLTSHPDFSQSRRSERQSEIWIPGSESTVQFTKKYLFHQHGGRFFGFFINMADLTSPNNGICGNISGLASHDERSYSEHS